MTPRPQTETRLLSVYPSHWGLGFALFEGPGWLVDWGVRGTGMGSSRMRKARSLRALEDLIACYRPEVLAVEDYRGKGSRRCGRIRTLIDEILKAAAAHGVKTQTLSRGQLKALFPGADNKHGMALQNAERFPEQAPRVPPDRRFWMSEDYRTTIFDAVGFGVACFRSVGGGVLTEVA